MPDGSNEATISQVNIWRSHPLETTIKQTSLFWGTRDNENLGGGNSKIFGMFTPKFREDEPILTNIFRMG